MSVIEAQRIKASVAMSKMVYEKYLADAYYIKGCSKDYDKEKVSTYKLRRDFYGYGLDACTLKSYIKCNLEALVVCDYTPPKEEEQELETSECCNDVFEQASPADIWVVIHDLGYRPNVTTVSNINGQEVEVRGLVAHIDVNKLEIRFSEAISGKAYLS